MPPGWCRDSNFGKELIVTSDKKAILLVAFGTTVPHAAEAFDRFETVTQSRFPDAEIRWAYTSSIVRKKLAERGERKESVGEALERFAYDGYRNIAVQSLHTIAGAEYHKMLREISVFQHKPVAQNIAVAAGKPLLANYPDAERVAKAMVAGAPSERKHYEALVFMGHGSEHHASDLAYVALASMLNNIDNRAWMGTVEGHPTLGEILIECKASGCHTAWLIPFMSIAGDHAIHDMAGDDHDSWKTMFENESITCKTVLMGTLDNEAIRDIWLDHLQRALTEAK
ncbi:MAG: sirohydrochlorin cobaltochelatase [Chitinivibrionales bacterium]|nr:sirohydrochlorin cobaltochelatase [Chitinivibrionales bacterium]